MLTANRFAAARISLSRLAVAGLVVALCVTTSHCSIARPLIGQLMVMLGWLLVGIGVLGRIWSGSYICGRKNQQLMTTGPYSLCRNPLYLFSFIGGMGIMLITQTLLFPAVFALVYLTYYRPVIRAEEQMLQRMHGENFEQYRHEVPLFWPRRLCCTEAEQYPISARHFRRFLLEVIWFVILAALIQLLRYLHDSGVLPNWYSVY